MLENLSPSVVQAVLATAELAQDPSIPDHLRDGLQQGLLQVAQAAGADAAASQAVNAALQQQLSDQQVTLEVTQQSLNESILLTSKSQATAAAAQAHAAAAQADAAAARIDAAAANYTAATATSALAVVMDFTTQVLLLTFILAMAHLGAVIPLYLLAQLPFSKWLELAKLMSWSTPQQAANLRYQFAACISTTAALEVLKTAVVSMLLQHAPGLSPDLVAALYDLAPDGVFLLLSAQRDTSRLPNALQQHWQRTAAGCRTLQDLCALVDFNTLMSSGTPSLTAPPPPLLLCAATHAPSGVSCTAPAPAQQPTNTTYSEAPSSDLCLTRCSSNLRKGTMKACQLLPCPQLRVHLESDVPASVSHSNRGTIFLASALNGPSVLLFSAGCPVQLVAAFSMQLKPVPQGSFDFFPGINKIVAWLISSCSGNKLLPCISEQQGECVQPGNSGSVCATPLTCAALQPSAPTQLTATCPAVCFDLSGADAAVYIHHTPVVSKPTGTTPDAAGVNSSSTCSSIIDSITAASNMQKAAKPVSSTSAGVAGLVKRCWFNARDKPSHPRSPCCSGCSRSSACTPAATPGSSCQAVSATLTAPAAGPAACCGGRAPPHTASKHQLMQTMLQQCSWSKRHSSSHSSGSNTSSSNTSSSSSSSSGYKSVSSPLSVSSAASQTGLIDFSNPTVFSDGFMKSWHNIWHNDSQHHCAAAAAAADTEQQCTRTLSDVPCEFTILQDANKPASALQPVQPVSAASSRLFSMGRWCSTPSAVHTADPSVGPASTVVPASSAAHASVVGPSSGMKALLQRWVRASLKVQRAANQGTSSCPAGVRDLSRPRDRSDLGRSAATTISNTNHNELSSVKHTSCDSRIPGLNQSSHAADAAAFSDSWHEHTHTDNCTSAQECVMKLVSHPQQHQRRQRHRQELLQRIKRAVKGHISRRCDKG